MFVLEGKNPKLGVVPPQKRHHLIWRVTVSGRRNGCDKFSLDAPLVKQKKGHDYQKEVPHFDLPKNKKEQQGGVQDKENDGLAQST